MDNFIGFNGHFEVEVIDANSGEIIKKFDFPNTILDPALEAICAGSASFGFDDSVTGRPALLKFLALGSGSSTPTTLDTKLFGELTGSRQTASFATVSNVVTSSLSVFQHERVWEYGTTVMNGQTIAEIGLGYTGSYQGDVTDTPLAVHQLLKDAFGTPTSINKDENQIVRVKYLYRVFPPTLVTSGTVVIQGQTLSWEFWPINLQNPNGWGRFGRGLGLPKQGEGTFISKAYNEIIALGHPSATLVGYPATNASTASVVAYSAHTYITTVTSSLMAADMSTSIGTILYTPYQNSGSDWLYALRFTSGNVPKDNASIFHTYIYLQLGRYDANPSRSVAFNSVGTSSFSVPFGVSQIYIDAAAGGGGGGLGSGGGAGASVQGVTMSVNFGDTFAVIVGGGGAGSSGNGVAGSPTYINSIVLKGGANGTSGNSAGGVGGAVLNVISGSGNHLNANSASFMGGWAYGGAGGGDAGGGSNSNGGSTVPWFTGGGWNVGNSRPGGGGGASRYGNGGASADPFLDGVSGVSGSGGGATSDWAGGNGGTGGNGGNGFVKLYW